MNLNCPNCKNAFEVVRSGSQTEVTCPSCKSKISLIDLLSINDELSHTLSLVKDNPDENLGEEIGQFRLEKVLGHGGFGTVFEAYDVRLERRVALKLPKMATMSRWQAEVFIREAQAAAQLQHPNIVSVHEIGREDGRVFIVSELIDGMTLNEWRTAEKPDANKAAILLAKIARALHVAHAAGVVHRDIKPRNILIDYQGEPHITDFGLAKRDNPQNDSITRPGQVIGTPAYMSPEQAMGKADEADGRTDIYSLGVILYEMLVGKRPYRGESDVITEEVIRGGAASPKELDKSIHPDIDAICMKAMKTISGKRFRTAGELAEDLENFAKGAETETRPFSPSRKFISRFQRIRAPLFAGFGAVLVSLFAAYYSGLFDTKDSIPDNRLVVEFDVESTKDPLTVRVVRYAEEKGKIDYANIVDADRIRFSKENTRFRMQLEPGWYCVEITHGDDIVHEVLRYVPQSIAKTTRSDFNCTAWKAVGKKVVWHKVVDPKLGSQKGTLMLGPEKLIEVVPISFEAHMDHKNSDGTPVRQRDYVTLGNFFAGVNEVKASDFTRVTKIKLPDLDGDEAAYGISFAAAADYCEKVGGRLPLFEEYLYIATNGGIDKFPNGTDWESRNWLIPSNLDKNMNGIGIRNLYSSALEWTMDYAVPLNPKGSYEWDEDPFMPNFSKSRIVVGGPAQLVNQLGGNQKVETVLGPSEPICVPLDQSKSGIGLRCYRSMYPRLRATNGLIKFHLEQNTE